MTSRYMQPAAEFSDGKFYLQQHGGECRWQDTDRDGLLAALASSTPPAFRSILAAKELDGDGRPTRTAGPLYFDMDGTDEEFGFVIAQFKKLLGKLRDLGLDLDAVRLYATGGRGFHVEIAQSSFMGKVHDDGIADLHLIYREVAHALYADTLDLRVYSVKRMWRTPNVQRDSGAYKVPITADEALSLTPESYAELCSAPRPHPELAPATFNPALAKLYAEARDKVFAAKARRSKSSQSAEAFKVLTGGQVPPTIDDLMAGRARLKADTGFNQIALQAALVAHGLGMDEAEFIARCRGLIASHQGDGSRYATAAKRERELRDQFRYMQGNPCYSPSIPAVLALLDPAEQADDLRDLVADVPDNGFSVLDLMTGHGKRRRLRTDIEALVQLLVRDPRLDGLCYYDEFGQVLRCSKSWKDAMEIVHAPDAEGEMHDDHARSLMHWFAREWKLAIAFDAAFRAMVSWAQCDRRNTVLGRLEAYAQAWDGEARLDSWLIDHAHAVTEDDDGNDYAPLIRAAGTKWLLSAVARAFRPGCQADVALVLTGPQGFRKSSILRVLGEALGKDAYADGFDLSGDAKDTRLKLRGKVVVEWAEMTGLTKRDIREVKNFMTERDDAYRQPYDRASRKWPRTAVIAGTSNESELFADPTGNRRFWTVEIGQRITREDLARFEASVAQLWGEACHRYKAGESWWIDPDDEPTLHRMAQDRQEAAQVSTPYDALAVELAKLVMIGDAAIKSHTQWVNDHAWFGVLEMQRFVADLNHGQPMSDREWSQMTIALKRQGWDTAKRTRAKTVHYKIGDRLRSRLQPMIA